MNDILATKKDKIVLRKKPVTLRGVNFGGWLMMEAYILHAPNFPEHKFKGRFKKELGEKALKDFEQSFRSSFIEEKDVQRVASWGLNCIRVPFNHRLVEAKPFYYSREGVRFLDKVVSWGEKYRVWIILDLHGATGCQNHDWHSDSDGKADLWHHKTFQHRTFALWEFLADRYKDEPWVAGYDILNEAVVGDAKILNHFYKELIRAIRRVDKKHIVFVEGNRWAQDLDCLEEFDDDNLVLSIHYYLPNDFTFNVVPHLSYPLVTKKIKWNKQATKRFLSKYKKISQQKQVPIYVGEFGVNYRQGHYGEDKWVQDTIACFKEFGFHWTYWTYKAVKYGINPDGLLSYYPNPAWVNRLGPVTGWDTYHLHWPHKKKEMMASWKSKNFSPNNPLIKVLKDAAR